MVARLSSPKKRSSGDFGSSSLRRHALEDGDALLGRGFEEGRAVHLAREPIDAIEAFLPLPPLLGVVLDLRILLGQRAIEVGGDPGGARAARVLVGGNDQLGELVDQGELGRGEEERGGGGGRGGHGRRGRCSRRRCRRQRARERRGERRAHAGAQQLAAADPIARDAPVVAHRFPRWSSSAR